MEQHQRVCMAIERAVAAARHGRTDSGQILPEFRRVHDLKRDFTDRAVQTVQQVEARPHIGIAEAQPKTPWLPQAGIHARQLEEFLLQSRPKLNCVATPARISRQLAALALHPNEAEIASGSAKSHITLIQNADVHARPCRAVGDRRPDKAAPNHCHSLVAHPRLQSVSLLDRKLRARITPTMPSTNITMKITLTGFGDA